VTSRVLYAAFDVVPSPKGASCHITHFTRELLKAGYSVTLYTAGLADMPSNGRWAGARIIRFRSDEPNFLRRALQFGDAVWEHLRAHASGYDVVHFRDIWSGSAALLARQEFGYRYHTVFEANGLPSVELKYHYPSLQGSALTEKLKAQEGVVLHAADAVICVSRVTAIYLQSRGVSADRLTVIPNGVDPTLFEPGDEPVARPPRIVYAGTLASWQGIATLIRAMPLILARFPDVGLHLIGPAKKRHQKALVKLAAKLGLPEEAIRFVGSISREEMPSQLRAASLCVAPLGYNDRNVTQGCCPIKLLEYAATARPIVAADLPVVRELLGEDEALFFQPGNEGDLARQVVRLLSHPEEAEAMGRRGRERVTRDFRWDQAGARLGALYASLIGQAARDTKRSTVPVPALP